jgi:hypothetical protein
MIFRSFSRREASWIPPEGESPSVCIAGAKGCMVCLSICFRALFVKETRYFMDLFGRGLCHIEKLGNVESFVEHTRSAAEWRHIAIYGDAVGRIDSSR